MWTRTLRHAFTACGLVAMLGAAAPLGAQTDSTSYPRLSYGGGGGVGGLNIACGACAAWEGTAALFGELEGGLDIVRPVRVLVRTGTSSATSGDLKGSASWAMLGTRLSPPMLHGWYVQGGAGVSQANVRKEHQEACDALCNFLTLGLGGNEVTVTDLDTTVSAPAYHVAIGGEAPLGRRTALGIELQVMLGKVTVTGVSLRFVGF